MMLGMALSSLNIEQWGSMTSPRCYRLKWGCFLFLSIKRRGSRSLIEARLMRDDSNWWDLQVWWALSLMLLHLMTRQLPSAACSVLWCSKPLQQWGLLLLDELSDQWLPFWATVHLLVIEATSWGLGHANICVVQDKTVEGAHSIVIKSFDPVAYRLLGFPQ